MQFISCISVQCYGRAMFPPFLSPLPSLTLNRISGCRGWTFWDVFFPLVLFFLFQSRNVCLCDHSHAHEKGRFDWVNVDVVVVVVAGERGLLLLLAAKDLYQMSNYGDGSGGRDVMPLPDVHVSLSPYEMADACVCVCVRVSIAWLCT